MTSNVDHEQVLPVKSALNGDKSRSHAPSSPRPESVKLPHKPSAALGQRPSGLVNGTANHGAAHDSDADAQADSEAETVVLPDDRQDEPQEAKKTLKKEPLDDDESRDDRAGSSSHPDEMDAESPSKGERPDHQNASQDDVKPERVRRKSSASVLSSPRSNSTLNQQDASSSLSAKSPSLPNAGNRGRSLSITETRKRKIRDDSTLNNLEPPRQRHKTEGLSREMQLLRNQPTSPSAAGQKNHRRAASTQSATHAVPGRKRKDLPNLVLKKAGEQKSWSTGSSSEGEDSSPQPSHHTARRKEPQSARSVGRSLISPARTTSNDKAANMKRPWDKFGATRLAREAEKGLLDSVKDAYEEHPEFIDQGDYAGITPLQKASLNGHYKVVEYLLNQGCNAHCMAGNRDTPLIDAAENGHIDIVKLLLKKGQVNPHHQNKKGQRALDVLDEEDDHYEELRKLIKDAMLQYDGSGSNNEPPQTAKTEPSTLLYNEFNQETLKEKAAAGDITNVGELLLSNIKPNIHCGIAAARAGHEEILSLFIAYGLNPDPDPAKHSETPMIVAIGRGHLEVIKLLLQQDFDPTRRTKDGLTYWELAKERHGPQWEKERDLLKAAYDEARAKQGLKTSPRRERKVPQVSQAAGLVKSKFQEKSSPRRLEKSERSPSPARAEVKRKAERKPTQAEFEPAKRGRLMTGRQLAEQKAKRGRKTVEEDSSSEDSSPARVRRPLKKSESRRPAISDDDDDLPTKKELAPSRDTSPANVRVRKKQSEKVDAKRRAISEDEKQPPRKKIAREPLSSRDPSPSRANVKSKIGKKMESKVRANSEDVDKRTARKVSTQSSLGPNDKSKKSRSSPLPKGKVESGDEAQRKAKKNAGKARSTMSSKARGNQPTPETSTDTEQQTSRKQVEHTMEVMSASASGEFQSEDGPASPTATAKSANMNSPSSKLESTVTSPSAPPQESRTPTPVREARIAEEQAQKAEEEARLKREEEARIAAEQARLEEERRLEAERKAEERAQRAQRLDKLPPALKAACERGLNRPFIYARHADGDEWGITRNFLPLYVFPLSEIDPTVSATLPEDDAARNTLWICSWQAVGLLGLPELDISLFYPHWERKNVTESQLQHWVNYGLCRRLTELMEWVPGRVAAVNGVTTAHNDTNGETGTPRSPQNTNGRDSRDRTDPDCDWQREQIESTRSKFLAMSPLFWIRYSDFEHELRNGPDPVLDTENGEKEDSPAFLKKKRVRGLLRECTLELYENQRLQSAVPNSDSEVNGAVQGASKPVKKKKQSLEEMMEAEGQVADFYVTR
jgi:ankyrin repeat protein